MPALIQRLSRRQPIEDFIAALERDGCIVITDFISAETVKRANADIQPHLEAQGSGAKVGGTSPRS
jgi:hypothetical protein